MTLLDFCKELDTHALRPRLRAFYERHGFVFVEVKVFKGDRHTAFYEYTLPDQVSVHHAQNEILNNQNQSRISYISNEILSLVEYNESDDHSLYEDWLDPDTQKGYNGVYVTTLEDFQTREIRQHFFAMIRLDSTGEIIGAIGISPPETIPDLAIRIFKPYRRKGYGTSAFALATKYAVEELKITELHAGAYPDNTGSLKMLERCGYVPFPAGNVLEKHYITGEDIVQMDFIYSPITIRLAVPADAPDMAEVHMRSWEVAYKNIIPAEYINQKNATRHALYARVITDDNTNSYIIQYAGKTIGIMKIAPPQDDDVGDDFYGLHYIYLHPDYFRMGIGTQAMEFAFEKARCIGKTGMIVWVFDENINSIRFYEKCGFHTDGKIMNSEYGKENGRIRMRRDL
jgi:RimJ/RimL family protein N-acetyltransferase